MGGTRGGHRPGRAAGRTCRAVCGSRVTVTTPRATHSRTSDRRRQSITSTGTTDRPTGQPVALHRSGNRIFCSSNPDRTSPQLTPPRHSPGRMSGGKLASIPRQLKAFCSDRLTTAAQRGKRHRLGCIKLAVFSFTTCSK